jgi:hypothetical protein
MKKKTMRAAHNLELTAWERKYGELKDADDKRIERRDRTISTLHQVIDENHKDINAYATFANDIHEAGYRLALALAPELVWDRQLRRDQNRDVSAR